MEIKINYGGHDDAFEGARGTQGIKDLVSAIDGVDSCDVKCISQLSESTGLSTDMIINCASLGLSLVTFIYTLYQNRRGKNQPFNIQVNNQVVNIAANDSVEEIQLKMQMNNQPQRNKE